MRTAAKLGGLLVVVVVFTYAVFRDHSPDHVRVFRDVEAELTAHANAIRSGEIRPEAGVDPREQAKVYPTTGKLLRKHSITCRAWGEVIVYTVLSLDDPHDGRSPHFVTPLDGTLDAERLGHTFGRIWYRWKVIGDGKWAYWYGL